MDVCVYFTARDERTVRETERELKEKNIKRPNSKDRLPRNHAFFPEQIPR